MRKNEKNQKLSKTDRFILDFIERHIDEAPRWSCTELAERTYTSASTIVRFTRKLGFGSYREFIHELQKQVLQKAIRSEPIEQNETLNELIKKVESIENDAIQKTKVHLSVSVLECIQYLLSQNQYIDLIAEDASAGICQYAQHLFMHQRKICSLYTMNDLQILYSLNVLDGHVVIFVSRHGRFSDEKNKIIQTLKQKRVPMILISADGNEEANKKMFDYILIASMEDEIEHFGKMTFYTSLKFYFDLFYGMLLTNDLEGSSSFEESLKQNYGEKKT